MSEIKRHQIDTAKRRLQEKAERLKKRAELEQNAPFKRHRPDTAERRAKE